MNFDCKSKMIFFLALGSQFCVTIVTGNEDDGILEVSIDKIHFQARKFRRGERVIDICLPKLTFIVLKNPTNDGWTGEIAITRDGRPRDIDCKNCNGEFSQGKLSVGGKDREGTNHGPILKPAPGIEVAIAIKLKIILIILS